MNKTKDVIVDLRNRCKINTIGILGEEVEVMDNCRYLGVHLDSRFDWKCNTKAVSKTWQSRLGFLRKLRSFNIYTKILHIFYKSGGEYNHLHH